MFRPDDIVEATEPCERELGPIAVGERHAVHQVSASGAFIRLHGAESFIRASGFKWVGVLPRSEGEASHSAQPFEKMEAGEGGWTDWVHPLPGYLMKCCDCGLVHELQFSIVPNGGETTTFNPGEGEDGVVIFRARRAEERPGAEA